MLKIGMIWGFMFGLIVWIVSSTVDAIKKEHCKVAEVRSAEIIRLHRERLVRKMRRLESELTSLDNRAKRLAGSEWSVQYDARVEKITSEIHTVMDLIESLCFEALIMIIKGRFDQNPNMIFRIIEERSQQIRSEMDAFQILLERIPGDRSGIHEIV